MRFYLLPIAAFILLGAHASALDLIIDRVLISKHPIPAPYFVCLAAKADRAEATFQPPKTPYGSGGITGSPIEVPMNLVLKDVQKNSWATVTLQLDTDGAAAATYKALKKHTGRLQILEGSHSAKFTPALYNTPFIYEVFYHTK